MTGPSVLRALRPLAGGVAAMPFLKRKEVQNEAPKKDFKPVTVMQNKLHTKDTRKITFKLSPDSVGWNASGAIVNFLIRTGADGAGATGCCACCKCDGDCSCPKGPNGCCGCCKCPAPCECPKKPLKESTSVTRPYNPIALDTPDTFTLLVKKYENGKMGSALHNLKAGDTVEAKGPNRQWTFKPGQYKQYGFVAGGTGITPIIQVIGDILKNDTAPIVLVAANKTFQDVLLERELADLSHAHPGRLTVYFMCEARPCSGGNTGFGEFIQGKPNPTRLKNLLPAPAEGLMVMVCGRKEMTEAIAGPKNEDFTQGEVGGMLMELGYTKKQVWKI